MAKLDSSKCFVMVLKGHTMRKLIISLLLASVAASPAVAFQRSDRDSAREEREQRAKEEREERQKARQERQQSREERQPVQVEREPRSERVRQRSNDAPAAAVEAPADRQRFERRVEDSQQPSARDARQRFDRQQIERQQIERQQVDRQRFDRRADQQPGTAVARETRQRIDARRQQWDQNRAERLARQEAIRNQRPPVISPTPRPGTQPPPPPVARPSNAPTINWSSNHWRKDRRYDWYKHRNKYWWLFQLGWYSDPFGWGYQPYGIGWRMWPSYYSSRYWLDDPWQYRLPYAPAGTRWIRYWDDAILVDLWSGQVIDVIYNFFW